MKTNEMKVFFLFFLFTTYAELRIAGIAGKGANGGRLVTAATN